jgi:hypothetical protein
MFTADCRWAFIPIAKNLGIVSPLGLFYNQISWPAADCQWAFVPIVNILGIISSHGLF